MGSIRCGIINWSNLLLINIWNHFPWEILKLSIQSIDWTYHSLYVWSLPWLCPIFNSVIAHRFYFMGILFRLLCFFSKTWSFIWITINRFFLTRSHIIRDWWAYPSYRCMIISASRIRYLFRLRNILICVMTSELLYSFKPLLLFFKNNLIISYDTILRNIMVDWVKSF